MNWTMYFKTNWFYMALGALVMFGIVRKYPHLSPLRFFQKKAAVEKSTEKAHAPAKGAALLGYVAETPTLTAPPAETDGIAPEKAEAFLRRFASVAVSERKKFGIPASVILACAFANSQAGQHEQVQATNNFFSLPCDEAWEGEQVQRSGKCLRRYETAWASFRDFSIYISTQEWTGALKKKAGKDWQAWTEQLGASGIANPKAMRKVIEAYRLYELDGV